MRLEQKLTLKLAQHYGLAECDRNTDLARV